MSDDHSRFGNRWQLILAFQVALLSIKSTLNWRSHRLSGFLPDISVFNHGLRVPGCPIDRQCVGLLNNSAWEKLTCDYPVYVCQLSRSLKNYPCVDRLLHRVQGGH